MGRARNRKNEVVSQLDRRRRVADLYLAGQSQHQIAQTLGCGQGTVSKDLTALREQWLSSAQTNFAERQALELARLDRLEAEAWSAFERSNRDLETETDRIESTGAGDRVVTSVTKKQVNADVRYLEVVAKCVELRSKITGILKPANLSMNTTVIQWDDLAVTVNTPTLDTVEQRIKSILDRAPANVIEHIPDPLLLETSNVRISD